MPEGKFKTNFGDSGSVHKRFKGNVRGYGGVDDTNQRTIPSEFRGPQQGAGKGSGSTGAKQFRDKG